MLAARDSMRNLLLFTLLWTFSDNEGENALKRVVILLLEMILNLYSFLMVGF